MGMDLYDILDEEFRPLVLPNARLEVLATGRRWLEGPVWLADQDCLLVSDLPEDRVLRWCPDGSVSTLRQGQGWFENGHARDRQGRLLACSHRQRCITRTEWDGRITRLAEHYKGLRLNSPNDVAVHPDGSIWFTDPPYGIQTDYEGGKQVSELPAQVYRLDAELGELAVATDRLAGPNGLCFSPDGKRLYIAETGLQFAAEPVQHIRVFDVAEDGRRLDEGRFFHQVAPGNADGMRCDEAGRLWTSAGDGVHCLAPDGRLLGRIHVPAAVANLCFGGPALSRLFLCCGDTLYGIATNTRGAALL
ncbi:SMP-30/gluconolactonase/LRE family protein [Xylophilus rhododendri]|uniref:SMP-30/gluconolactonase/LRE family protein n=1 Tax=Xylophilus rhododendri TaxID=2697032 RepID=A0A857J3S8_9BURK|nr:SMP-30/gluconolactonase/LRE family protein [Xylophilus rhododendri]QHI97515.1 SMP-30/gluconolactonase/LRE family protein [Xylophilus rhododendri]